jgi:hypothetical protein
MVTKQKDACKVLCLTMVSSETTNNQCGLQVLGRMPTRPPVVWGTTDIEAIST